MLEVDLTICMHNGFSTIFGYVVAMLTMYPFPRGGVRLEMDTSMSEKHEIGFNLGLKTYLYVKIS